MAESNERPSPYKVTEDAGKGFASPYKIIKHLGEGFVFGTLVGFPYHFIKGPKGARLEYIAIKVPRTGGALAVWSALYETMSGGLAHVRHKEDPWNSFLAGGLSFALLDMRRGFRPAFYQFLIGGAMFGGLESLNVMSQRLEPRDHTPPTRMV